MSQNPDLTQSPRFDLIRPEWRRMARHGCRSRDNSQVNQPLTLSPLDGRYRETVAPLLPYFTEFALNRARLYVEIEWLIALTNGMSDIPGPLLPGAPTLDPLIVVRLRSIPDDFDDDDAAELADIEAETKHDVKAVEYFLAKRLTEFAEINPALIHFALTSEDINNVAYALNVMGALRNVWLPAAEKLVSQLSTLANDFANIPMLARTHGQAASPTTLGKELAVFAYRLNRQLARISSVRPLAKFSGATGTFGAHQVAVPAVNWPAVAEQYVSEFDMEFNPLTTQIESHDWLVELFTSVVHFGRILHNLATDMWTYISLGYFRQRASSSSVGSSTMPHKINPIRFENAEANLEISAALFENMAATLVSSRLQRDLSDSSTLRNIGVAFGHSLLAIENLRKGLASVTPDTEALAKDLDANWEVLAEPIQTVMRAAAIAGHPGLENPYERLKEFSKCRRLDKEIIAEFVRGLNLPHAEEERLLNLTPATYTGLAEQLAEQLQ